MRQILKQGLEAAAAAAGVVAGLGLLTNTSGVYQVAIFFVTFLLSYLAVLVFLRKRVKKP